MKQFTFLQEGSNRILSKSKNPSGLVLMCEKLLKYTLHINLHILLIILYKATSKIQESRKSNKSTSKVTSKTILIILFNLFFICYTFGFQATQIFR